MPLPSAALRLALRAGLAVQPSSPLAEAARAAVSERWSAADADADVAVDRLRRRLAASPATVEVVDFGAGTRGGQRPPVRRVAEIVRRAAVGPAWGRVLYGLARALRPVRVLELGTNLGLSAAHLAAALRQTEAKGGPAGRLVTLEGAPALADLAQRHLADLGHAVGRDGRVEVVVGPFDETLADVCRREGPFDLVFVDGHHEEAAALRYVEAVRAHLAPGGVVGLDDVEPLRPVWRAWRRLRAAHPTAAAVSLGKLGLLALGADAEARVGAAPPVARLTPPTLPPSAPVR